MSVIQKLKATLLDPEADRYDPKALEAYTQNDLPKFAEIYASSWGIDTEEIWFPAEESGASVQFVADDPLNYLAQFISSDHPGLLFELYYCAPGEFSGLVEFVEGEPWDERHVETTEEGRGLSEWHRQQLEGEE